MPGGPSAKVISAPRLLCVLTCGGSPYTFSRVCAAGKGGWLVQAPCTCSRVGATVSWRRKSFHFYRLMQVFACTTHPNYRFLAIQFSPSVYILLAFNVNLSSPGLASIQSCSLETVMDEPVSCVRLRTSSQHVEKHLHRDKCHATSGCRPQRTWKGNTEGRKKKKRKNKKVILSLSVPSPRDQPSV